MSSSEELSRVERVNKYSKISAHFGGKVTLGPKEARISNFIIPTSMGFVGIAFFQVCGYLLTKGYYGT